MSPKVTRIVQITPRFCPLIGGTETHVKEVAGRLARSGVRVTVLTTDATGESPRTEEHDGVHVERVRAWPRSRDYRIAPGLVRRLLCRDYDLAHVQSYHTFVPLIAMAALCLARQPYVVTPHAGGTSSRLRKMLRLPQLLLLAPLLRRAARIICVGPSERAYFARALCLPEDRFVTIPNGLDTTGLRRQTARPHNPEPVFVCAARLEKYKGQARLIRGFAAYVAQYGGGQLRLVGTGPYEGELRMLAQRLGVAERVLFTHFAAGDRAALSHLVGTADLFVLLSESEAHSVAVLEALALGVPVLVANTSGLADVVAAGLASGVPLVSTAEELATAMHRAARHGIAPAIEALPTWDATAHSVRAVYEEVLGCSLVAQHPTALEPAS
jgi:glycosyltransferase involved in cell wall biosynthesis